jgi:hypothetical protein
VCGSSSKALASPEFNPSCPAKKINEVKQLEMEIEYSYFLIKTETAK